VDVCPSSFVLIRSLKMGNEESLKPGSALSACIEAVREWSKGLMARDGLKFGDHLYVGPEGKYASLVLFTATHEYRLRFRPTESGDRGYLGAVASLRLCDPGEDWHRGCDLADGPFCKEVFDAIVMDMLEIEMLPAKRPVRCLFDKQEAMKWSEAHYVAEDTNEQ